MSSGNLTVLLMDDEPEALRSLQEELREAMPRANIQISDGTTLLIDAMGSLEKEETKDEKAEDRPLQVRCFGFFAAFTLRAELKFTRRKTLEVLAYLVDQQGRLCTHGEILDALWDSSADLDKAMLLLRQLLYDLRKTMEKAGCGDVIIRRYGLTGLRTNLMDCDYYDYIAENDPGEYSWNGVYMKQYAWAQERRSWLMERAKK